MKKFVNMLLAMAFLLAPASALAKDAYLMRSGDEVQMIVYRHEDISTKEGTAYVPYVVRPDGKLALPLIGDIEVAGKTVEEATIAITKAYSYYLKNPRISLNITKCGK